MEVVKWIATFLVVGLAVYLTIDTTIWAVKKFKKKKQDKALKDADKVVSEQHIEEVKKDD